MPAEETLWEGSPAIKMLALEVAWTAAVAVIVPLVIVIAYHPALRELASLSPAIRRMIADYEPGLRLAATAFALVLVGPRVARLVWHALALRGHRYRLSNQRLVLESGVFSRTLTEIDVRTIDEVSFRQSFAERLLDIGQITILSSEPGAQAPRRAVRLVGIPEPRAVRETIRNAAYAATGQQMFVRST